MNVTKNIICYGFFLIGWLFLSMDAHEESHLQKTCHPLKIEDLNSKLIIYNKESEKFYASKNARAKVKKYKKKLKAIVTTALSLSILYVILHYFYNKQSHRRESEDSPHISSETQSNNKEVADLNTLRLERADDILLHETLDGQQNYVEAFSINFTGAYSYDNRLNNLLRQELERSETHNIRANTP